LLKFLSLKYLALEERRLKRFKVNLGVRETGIFFCSKADVKMHGARRLVTFEGLEHLGTYW
jgi:hypothetical protein